MSWVDHIKFWVLVFCVVWLTVMVILDFTTPETGVTTIHKQDRLQLPCPQGANE